MAKLKISPELKEQARTAVQNPREWWRGADLPEEKLRPWELGIQFFSEALRGFSNGFTQQRDRFYLGMGPGRIPPNMKSVSDVINITWDALNDPPIGMHMDRRNYGEGTLRNIMRVTGTFNHMVALLLMFNLGLSPLQRVILWTGAGIAMDAVGTAGFVADMKIRAAITPHTDQRGVLQLFRSLGVTVGAMFTGLPMILMGLRDVLNITDYQIIVTGASVFLPIIIFASWLPSFVKTRVDFSQKVQAEGEGKTAERKLTIRESFAVVKHNRWFMMRVIVQLAQLLAPATDHMFVYRFLIPNMHVRGRQLGAELLFTFKNIAFGWPSVVLSPFAVHAVKWFRGPLPLIRCQLFAVFSTHLVAFFVGYRTLPRLVVVWLMESLRGVLNNWSGVPNTMISFEMLDYVEWKTGRRSEGITESVNGIINKLIRENMGAVIGNAVLQWTGYLGWDTPAAEQPPRFVNTIWPLLHLGVAVRELIALAGALWFKYPHNPYDVERDLIERRAMAAEKQRLMEEHKLEHTAGT